MLDDKGVVKPRERGDASGGKMSADAALELAKAIAPLRKETDTSDPTNSACGSDQSSAGDETPERVRIAGVPIFDGSEAPAWPGEAADEAEVAAVSESTARVVEADDAKATDVDGSAEASSDGAGEKLPLIERAVPFVVWTSLLLVLMSGIYGVSQGGVDTMVALVFSSGVFLFASLLMLGAALRAFSPLLLTGLLFRRPAKTKRRAAVLAGGDILSTLGLAETILDADPDARLVTKRDGMVVYANDAYIAVSQEAGVIGSTGLPPRLDRLFGQSGSESSKMFRLARAMRSGEAADEVITQSMGAMVDGHTIPRRRFEVAVRPMQDKGDHILVRLREAPVETARDSLCSAFADYPRPVFAVERSGNFVWFNEAAGKLIGARAGMTVALQDFVLGETKDLLAGIWEDDPEEIEGRIRAREGEGGACGVVFTTFSRGGVGEGFRCVEMLPKSGVLAEKAAADHASDVVDAPIGVAVIEGDPGTDARLKVVNRVFAEAFGADQGMRLAETIPSVAIRDLIAALRVKAQGNALTRPFEVTIGEGATAKIYRLFARPIKRRRGAYGPRQAVLYAVDVSFQKQMEEDFAHDKRLKAIGNIAGSVAHDFNNFLQAILGATELMMRRHAAGDPSYPDLVSIRENGQRARNITANLLAFSRKQTLRSEVISVTDLIADFTPFLQRYVTEKVKVEANHGRNLPFVRADKNQLELALMNLAVNARDAMPKGGTLTIDSRRVTAADIETLGYSGLDEADHVLVEVADDGTGVPDDIAEKIFEPFFTTKGEGKGTGLGLSSVHGIIGQMGGRIFLHNRPGEGATFRIFLPALTEEQAAEYQPKKATGTPVREVDDLTGKGRILIVEDEDSVRGIVVRALSMCGYDITEACDGDEALDIIEESDQPYDVILSDIMMPEMDGPTLIQEAGDKIGHAKVIFMSGYAEAAMRDKLDAIDEAGYLQKPFTLKQVAATVKEAMGDG